MFDKTLRSILLGSCAVVAFASPALANETEDLRALIEQQKVQIEQQRSQMEEQKAQMEQQTKLLRRMQSRLDQIDRGQPVESVADINKRLDALENRQSAAAVKPVVAPADAVVGGDFPGSFKLPGSDTSIAIHGFTKLDMLYDIKQPLGKSDLSTNSVLPNGNVAQQRGPFVQLQASRARLNFETRTPTSYGTLRTFIEGDFFGGGAGDANQSVSNSTLFRLRHGYGELGPLLAGQTWTNFLLPTDLPETLQDAPQPGGVQIRQPQVRWTQHFGKFAFSGALENPSGDFRTSTGTTSDNAIPTATSDPANKVDRMPDVTAKAEYKSDFGYLGIAGLIRRFDVDDGLGKADDTTGGGGRVGAVLNTGYFLPALGKDKIGLTAFYGTGLGRYFDQGGGVNAAAVVKNFTTSPRIETQPSWGGQAWFQHWWTANLRSTIVYGIQRQHFSAAIPSPGNALTNQLQQINANLIWSPVKNVSLGVEAIFVDRDILVNPAAGQIKTGDAERVQVSAKYAF